MRLLGIGVILLAASGCSDSEPEGPLDANTDDGGSLQGDAGRDSAMVHDARQDDGGRSRTCDAPIELTQLRVAGADDASISGAPVMEASEDVSGLVYCEGDRIDRTATEICRYELPVNVGTHCDDIFPDYPEVCGALDDGGVCAGSSCDVSVGCVEEEDCAVGHACVCATSGPPGRSAVQSRSRCVPASCRSSADCGEHDCGAVPSDCGWDIVAFRCRTDDDECSKDSDCDGMQCTYDLDSARWVCRERNDCE